MIQTKFARIEEFASIRHNCLFCNTKLTFVFTTTFGTAKPAIPLIKSKCKDNSFEFKLVYNSANLNIDTVVYLDAKTNEAFFGKEIHSSHASAAISALEGLSPHVELQCLNKKCKMNYYLCSSLFHFNMTWSTETPEIFFNIRPFRLEWECFNVSKLWVKNDYPNKTTDIYSTVDDFNHKPMMIPMLDFKSMDSSKIANKILTMVNFS